MCPQTLYKLHPTFDKVLAGILSSDQCGTIMMLHGSSEKWDLAVIKRIADVAVAAAGILPRHSLFTDGTPSDKMCEALVQVSPLLDRLVLAPQRGHNAFLELLALADVVVDTYPFGTLHYATTLPPPPPPPCTWLVCGCSEVTCWAYVHNAMGRLTAAVHHR